MVEPVVAFQGPDPGGWADQVQLTQQAQPGPGVGAFMLGFVADQFEGSSLLPNELKGANYTGPPCRAWRHLQPKSWISLALTVDTYQQCNHLYRSRKATRLPLA